MDNERDVRAPEQPTETNSKGRGLLSRIGGILAAILQAIVGIAAGTLGVSKADPEREALRAPRRGRSDRYDDRRDRDDRRGAKERAPRPHRSLGDRARAVGHWFASWVRLPVVIAEGVKDAVTRIFHREKAPETDATRENASAAPEREKAETQEVKAAEAEVPTQTTLEEYRAHREQLREARRAEHETTLEESRTNSAKVREAKAAQQERQTGRADMAPER